MGGGGESPLRFGVLCTPMGPNTGGEWGPYIQEGPNMGGRESQKEGGGAAPTRVWGPHSSLGSSASLRVPTLGVGGSLHPEGSQYGGAAPTQVWGPHSSLGSPLGFRVPTRLGSPLRFGVPCAPMGPKIRGGGGALQPGGSQHGGQPPLSFGVLCAPVGPNTGGGGGVPTPRRVPIRGGSPHSSLGSPLGSGVPNTGGGGGVAEGGPSPARGSPPLNPNHADLWGGGSITASRPPAPPLPFHGLRVRRGVPRPPPSGRAPSWRGPP